MFKFVITLSVSFVVTVHAVTYNKNSLVRIRQTTQILDKIGTDEALPVVLILEHTEEPPGEKLSTPDDIIQAEIRDGRMVSGTKFSRMGLETQLFFCPEEDAQEPCLAPKNFGDFELLRCDVEPTPDVIEDLEPTTRSCGTEDAGIYHMVHFLLCPAKGMYQYVSTFVGTYEFCYNRQIEKILFTCHSILSPKLVDIGLFLLYRERELSYPYEYDPRYPIANYVSLYWQLNSSVVSRYRDYVIQYLVPSEDMPFGIWKKTINRSYNIELQHKLLFDFWNEINGKVRDEAIHLDSLDNQVKLLVRTGVFKINVDIPVDVNQMHNRWVKMVIAKKNDEELSGIVILMNNFLYDRNDTTYARYLLLHAEMAALCPSNLCNTNFKNRVEVFGGWVNCCRVTPQITKLFGLEKTLPFLKIRNLTI